MNKNKFFCVIFSFCFSFLLAEDDNNSNGVVSPNSAIFSSDMSSNKKESMFSVTTELSDKHVAITLSPCKDSEDDKAALLKKANENTSCNGIQSGQVLSLKKKDENSSKWLQSNQGTLLKKADENILCKNAKEGQEASLKKGAEDSLYKRAQRSLVALLKKTNENTFGKSIQSNQVTSLKKNDENGLGEAVQEGDKGAFLKKTDEKNGILDILSGLTWDELVLASFGVIKSVAFLLTPTDISTFSSDKSSLFSIFYS